MNESAKKNEISKDIKQSFVTYLDGGYKMNPAANTSNTYTMGVCKLDYKENELTVYLRRPGLLVGKYGQTIDALMNYLGCKIRIVEVDLVNGIQNSIEDYKGKK